MSKKEVCFIACLLVFPCFVYCQEEVSSFTGNSLTEMLFEEDNQEMAVEVYEEISEILTSKENINLVTKETLQKLPFLTDFQIFSFLEYRKKYGKIYSLNELYLITGFYSELINKFRILFEFTGEVDPEDPEQAFHSPLRQRALTRVIYQHPQRYGYSNDYDTIKKFHGEPLSRLFKYELTKGTDFRAGFTLESDAGEPVCFDSIQKGFGHQSAFIEYNGKRLLKKVIIGDFRILSAQGLIYSYGRTGKSSTQAFNRMLPILKKYSSTSESGFYRGAALNLEKGKTQLITFFSSMNESATLYRDESNAGYFRSLNASGLFRNKQEKMKWKNVRISDVGLILSRATDLFQLGYSMKYSRFTPNFLYQVRGEPWSGEMKTNMMLWHSGFYYLQLKNLLLMGEVALKNKGGISIQQKAALNIHPLFTLNLAYRYFSPEYFCPGAGSLSESSTLRNERGFYSAIITYPFHFLKLNAYIDYYHYPWIDYKGNFPLRGNDFAIYTEWYFHEKLALRFFFKTEKKDKKLSGQESNAGKMIKSRVNRLYGQYTWSFCGEFSTRFRLELKNHQTTKNQNTSGLLIYQELSRAFFREKLKFNFRYTLFDIPDWEVRIYAWEHDLLYSFSSPAWYKTGQNIFLNLRWKPGKIFNIGFKASVTSFTSERESGAGADYRIGKRFCELKGQVILKL